MSQTISKTTPMMKQYLEIKKRFPNEVLFFRMGDFYEMFLEDAVYTSKVLNIALTRRQDKIPMCGFPYHSLHNFVQKILDDGRNIAIGEQTENPANVQGRIVRRDVVRILTPGTIFEEELLQVYNQETHLLATVSLTKDASVCDIIIADVSRASIQCFQIKTDDLGAIIESNNIKELILPLDWSVPIPQMVAKVYRNYSESLKPQIDKKIKKAFEVNNLDILNLTPNLIKLLSQILGYIDEVAPPPTYTAVWRVNNDGQHADILQMDENALKTLEILTGQDGNKKFSLYGILNFCFTNQGKKQLASFLTQPSARPQEIENRYECVESINSSIELKVLCENQLPNCFDLSRITLQLQNKPKISHLDQIRSTLISVKKISNFFVNMDSKNSYWLQWANSEKKFPQQLLDSLLESLVNSEDLPGLLDERRIFKKGFSSTLDEFLSLSESSQEHLNKFEKSEREKLGITTLRVKYNRVIGYFIEISKGSTDKAPTHYVRRQTLVNGERYTTPELKQLEDKILSAKDEVIVLQKALFQNLIREILEIKDTLTLWSQQTAILDVFYSFATASQNYNLTRPTINTTSNELILKKSRHPVVEQIFKEETFIPNDVNLNTSDQHLAILTGPNMSGKSTYIRQIGLIQVMAQSGCFVPAEAASIPICDRVFTRIGAYDRLFKGESTFYVEMAECAKILHGFTERSLLLMDEVGRGTSTFDGISICRSMIEYLNSHKGGKPKTLFATHYTELAEMINLSNGIFGLTVQVIEENDKIIFLRRIIAGIADKSYGIYVADLAGLPKEVIVNAQTYLQQLENNQLWQQDQKKPATEIENPQQKEVSLNKKNSTIKLNQDTTTKHYDKLKIKEDFNKSQMSMFSEE